jgi:hypothetical protein
LILSLANQEELVSPILLLTADRTLWLQFEFDQFLAQQKPPSEVTRGIMEDRGFCLLSQATRTFTPITVETQSLQIAEVIASTFGKWNDMIDF